MQQQKTKYFKKKKLCSIKAAALKWLSRTQLHGANRLAEGDASWYWIPSMILLLILCTTLVNLIICRYQDNPTFMTQQEYGNYRLPFPSIIICPEVDFHGYKMREFLTKIKYPPSLNESYIRRVLPQLAVFFSPDVLYNIDDLRNLEYLLKYNNLDIEAVGRRLTVSCEEILVRCRWQNIYQDCSKIFRMELTRDGFCCVFNGRSLRRELRKGKKIKKNKATLYTHRFGYTSGLMMAVNQSQRPWNIDLSYKWIALQAGQHFVDTTFNGTPLNPGSEQWFFYYVFGFHIADTAKELSANLRRCSLADEELKYFPSYRRKYCTVECEMANTIKQCHCVRVVHPKPPGVSYCDAVGLECAQRVSTANCNCPPTCNVDTAIIRTSSFTLDSAIESHDHFYANLDYTKMTVVRTFIQRRQTTVKQRWPYYTYLDLFSQLGGMFNVFFGCSILTVLGIAHALWSMSLNACSITNEATQKPFKKSVKK